MCLINSGFVRLHRCRMKMAYFILIVNSSQVKMSVSGVFLICCQGNQDGRERERERVNQATPPSLRRPPLARRAALRTKPSGSNLLIPLRAAACRPLSVRTVGESEPVRCVTRFLLRAVEPLAPRKIFFNDRICILLRDVHGQKQPDQG